MAEAEQPDLAALTVQLLSAYVSNNTLPSSELAGLIESTRSALAGVRKAEKPEVPEHVPAVTVRKSLASRDHILSMIDGKPYKSLKRHLSRHGMTPADYRQRFGLPTDYPMVAPGYFEQRREVAKRLGLGRKPKSSNSSAPPSEAVAQAGPAAPSAQPGEVPKVSATSKPKRQMRKRVEAAKPSPAKSPSSEPKPRGRPRRAAAAVAPAASEPGNDGGS
ncbi:MAG: MucR family transcriptional regulator [Sphingobium sp.]|uniref:MucR family transcriptional regulator n=1 Tax=Sphingobium sp. TaxID=1912891 RepID=UPI0029A1D2D6|nr:MucR family transcriptional regulator [Sphingobium sp.]MDX3911158.1 MucR family transcriptional regulator [Sphingobium sp.]